MRFFPLIALFLATSAWADVAATYTVKGGDEIRISYRDSDHIRMQVSADNFLLLADGKVWSVMRQGGGWMAMDLNQMSGMMKGFGMPSGKGAEQEAGEASFSATGKTETVAGYQGEVYTVTDSAGRTHDMVLTDHDDVEQVSRAWLEFSAATAQLMGGAAISPDRVLSALDQSAPTGMLRQADNMVMQSLSTDDLADDVFALPAGTQVQKMPKMPAMPGGFPGFGG
mgnify:CR=1 FL=1|jgi:hypothetical protein